MSEKEVEPSPQDAETVPVPDKGGWIDGETGQMIPTPVAQPKATPKEPKKAS